MASVHGAQLGLIQHRTKTQPLPEAQTRGHIQIQEQSSRAFDELVVGANGVEKPQGDDHVPFLQVLSLALLPLGVEVAARVVEEGLLRVSRSEPQQVVAWLDAG